MITVDLYKKFFTLFNFIIAQSIVKAADLIYIFDGEKYVEFLLHL